MTRAGSDGRSSGRRSRPSRPPTIPPTITAELGLGEERGLSQTTSDMPPNEFSGTRNGRAVALRMGIVPTVWRDRGATRSRCRDRWCLFRSVRTTVAWSSSRARPLRSKS